MFENLKAQPADKILALMQLFRDDTREGKIDLGVGVYKNADGQTPIMRAVKTAEQQLWQAETTKSYVGLTGDPAFSEAMVDLVLGSSVNRLNVAAAAMPGGTGAIRQGFEMASLANPDVTVWVSDPTWPNHLSILDYLGINRKSYRYFDTDTRSVDFDGMMSDLQQAAAGDVVLLHGCCHNPTGANLTDDQWLSVVDLINKTGVVPMIDIAYQGFGDGLEADAQGVRLVASSVPETLIAASCSKNFGIYRERTGILMTVGGARKLTQGTLAFLNRQNFSFPPDHGARLVTMILNDPALRSDWEAEVNDVRSSMLELRIQLAAELKRATNSDQFSFLADHRGMFSRLGTGPDVVQKLRTDHAIYMVGDSRMNIAGLNAQSIPVLAEAIAACV